MPEKPYGSLPRVFFVFFVFFVHYRCSSFPARRGDRNRDYLGTLPACPARRPFRFGLGAGHRQGPAPLPRDLLGAAGQRGFRLRVDHAEIPARLPCFADGVLHASVPNIGGMERWCIRDLLKLARAAHGAELGSFVVRRILQRLERGEIAPLEAARLIRYHRSRQEPEQKSAWLTASLE